MNTPATPRLRRPLPGPLPTASLAGLAASLLLAPACGDNVSGQRDAAAPQADAARIDPESYLDRPLSEQIQAIESRALPCPDLAEAYAARIAALDDQGPAINAFISLIPDPRASAIALDPVIGTGLALPCVVIGVKDNIDMAGLPTTAGSLALADNLTAADAPAVARLRDAGALLIGKTNLSEWANFRGFSATSGWSSLGGQTKNGANPDYNPCGSSSGSAAAVAADMVAAAIGTETDGSITCPAAINGVVGMKPTVGLVSRTGVIPISSTQDTIGPITRTVADAALLLSVLAGRDLLDPATNAIPDGLDLDFPAQLEGATLAGLRIGNVTTLTGYDAAVDQVYQQELQRLEAAGATIVPVELPATDQYGADEYTVLLYEFKVGLEAYLAAHPQPGQPTDLAGLIAFNSANAAQVLTHFGQEIFEAAEQTTGLDTPAYLEAKERAARTIGEEGVLAVMAADNLDVLVAPSNQTPWMTDHANGDPFLASASSPAAVAGYPHITVPMGQVEGLPVALSIFAGPWQDARVLRAAHAYQQLPR